MPCHPDQVPKYPNHSGRPQSGESPQVGDPGGAIGQIKSVTSTFGQPLWSKDDFEQCTFVGTEGIARATRQAFEVVRFVDVVGLVARPTKILVEKGAAKSPHEFLYYDAQNKLMLRTDDDVWGRAAQTAFDEHALPRWLAAANQVGVRFWAGPLGGVALYPQRVDVQQMGRVDSVRPEDLTLALEDGGLDLVLRATAFYDARFIMGEMPNASLLMRCLLAMGAKPA